MSIKLVDDTKLTAIGTSIRTTGGTQALLTLDEMPAAIEALGGGGGGGFDWSQIKGGIAFLNASSQTSLDLTDMDMSEFTTCEGMFRTCSALTSIDMAGVDASKVTNAAYMFQQCSNLSSLNLPHFEGTSTTGISCSAMLYRCGLLPYLDAYEITGYVTDMSSMFGQCTTMQSVNLANIITVNCTNMTFMFEGANRLNDIIWSQDTTQVQPICTDPSSMGINSYKKFYVPDALVNDYKAATNWSTIASQIYSINDLPSALATLYAGHY